MMDKLVITLRRGLAGKPKTQLATLQALGLRRIDQIVVKPNNPEIRGMCAQLKHMLFVETQEMYDARIKAKAAHLALREPIVVKHFSHAVGSAQ
ncbi:hypothetical protein CYMTET_13698 [Cymbomonas tetramitiformis]|uniref:Large ribosomal subunit protein uL30m n=1 Tax=Cymbomonas tetramitiformis TaxID=36881 RepID=A0AAE0LB45_9CHLO|nr:hypothetical protein CYMTET_13698 [Cymbomonas tetramitiformis]